MALKVLFIYPDFKINIDQDTGRQTGIEKGGWYMEGAASMSAMLKQDGCEVSLYHLVEPEGKPAFQRRLEEEAPDLIGFITMTREYPQVKEYASWVKEVADIPVISGSYHPTTMPEEVIATEGIDMLCQGEGEDAMLELTRAMRSGEDYSGIGNLWVKKGGEVLRNPVRPLREDLDTLPLPDFGLFDFGKLISTQIKTGIVILSRGCPYSCTYCSNKKLRDIYPNKSKYSRFHSPAFSIEYLKKLIATCPQIEYLNFRDDILPWKGGWLEEFTRAYKREIKLPFICNYRANLVTPEIVRMLRDAGCYQMFFGVESGNDYIRNQVLNRHMDRDEIVRAFDACRDAGIKTVAYNMVGLPYEDMSAVLDTIKLNVEIRANISLNPIYYPYPDTRLFEVAVEEGFVPPVYDYREDRYVDQPTLRRDQLFFVRRYFKTFVHAYRLVRRLPAPLAVPAEKLVDRVWLSPRLPHRLLVRIAHRRDLLVERAKEAFRTFSPELYLKVRDRVRGVER
jgi:anaerobic magnesium-protoporphyrin IX monomethyl ester cyclase